MSHCAVCFSGLDSARAEPGLRPMLIDPLGADVLLALTAGIHHSTPAPVSASACCDQAARERARERFHELQPIAELTIRPTPATSEIVTMLTSTSHWPDILGLLGGYCRQPNATNSSGVDKQQPFKCDRKYLRDAGNTYLSPVIAGGNVLRQLHSTSGCLAALLQREASVGRTYDRVVHSRLDYLWLRPHPPLQLLDGRCRVWTPFGEDYGGLCDRHAVLDRTIAPIYLGRWDMILDGRVMQNDPYFSTHRPWHGRSSEKHLGDIVNRNNGSVCRFPPFAVLGCCGANSSHCRLRTCSGVTLPSELALGWQRDQLVVRGKYGTELHSAVTHALAATHPGATLRLTPYTQPRVPAYGGCFGKCWNSPAVLKVIVPAANETGLRAVLTKIFRSSTFSQRAAWVTYEGKSLSSLVEIDHQT